MGAPGEGVAYDDRFTKLPAAGCDGLAPDAPGRRWVLVHGVNGDGPEWAPVVDALVATAPPALLLYRWVPYDALDAAAQGLADGVGRVLACRPDAEVVVLAHSAGGVVAGWAVDHLVVPGEGRVRVVTVASPLAGTRPRARNDDGRPEARLLLDLGSAIDAYPAPAPGVSVLHLRTSAPVPGVPGGDAVMTPSAGRSPNDPAVAVPGARVEDLPPELTHDGALHYVAERLAGGDPNGWLAGE